MSTVTTDGQDTKCRRKIAENYNSLSKVQERYRQTDRHRRAIAKNSENFSLKSCVTGLQVRGYVFGRPFVKRFALWYKSVVCPVCLSVLSVCNVRALWPNGWTDQDETWHAGTPRPWQHATWGPSSPSPKGAQPPNFRPISVPAKWLNGS